MKKAEQIEAIQKALLICKILWASYSIPSSTAIQAGFARDELQKLLEELNPKREWR